jgi:hypothetical protein
MISKAVSPGAQAVPIHDGAGWHGSKGLTVSASITPHTLPAYSPELNPVENIGESLRKNKPASRLYQTCEDIAGACCEAWNALMATPGRIASVTHRSWAKVSWFLAAGIRHQGSSAPHPADCACQVRRRARP